MTRFRILLFNRHEPYCFLLARTLHQFDVVTPPGRPDHAREWNSAFRPLPSNCVEVSLDEAEATARTGRYDVAVCMDLQDLNISAEWRVPRVHVALDAIEAGPAAEQLYPLLNVVEVAYPSERKRREWGWSGTVVAPGIDANDYGGYTGAWVRVLRVGNFLRERDASRGFSIQEKILNGGDAIGFLGGRLTIPSTTLGINPTIPGVKPARSWDDLKIQYRSHRLFLSTLPPDHEDGYNLALLEAMATGMPVVALANPSCPIVDGENGFVSDDPRVLRGRIIELLRNPDLARQLGERAHRTVMEQFGIGCFLAEWERILQAAGDRGSLSLPGPVEIPAPPVVASDDCSPFAWSAADVGWAVGGCRPDDFHLLGVRLERLSPERWWGELIAFRSDRHRPMIWRGMTVTAGEGDHLSMRLPPCVQGLPPFWREDLSEWVERGVQSFLSDTVRRGAPRGILEPPLPDGIGPFDGTWIVPDDADARSYLRRARRYCWASGFAEDRVVLDLGCGVGDGSRILARRARRVVGVDSDHRAASFASLSYGDERLAFQSADQGRLPFAGGSFGLVVAVGLSSSSSGFFDTLGEALRVLRPSGRLALSCRLEERKTVAAWLEERFEAVTFWGQRPELGRAEITDEFAIETLGGNDESFVALAESPRLESATGASTASPGEELWRFPEPLLALHSAVAPGANGK